MTPIVGIFNATTDIYDEYNAKIYIDDEWEIVAPYVYMNGEWVPIGQAGCLMLEYITSDGKRFMTSDGKVFLVRNHM